jgi:hypothetical protein
VPIFSLARLTAERARSLVWLIRLVEKGQQMGAAPHLPQSKVAGATEGSPQVGVPAWPDVEELLQRLAATGRPIPTPLSPEGTISSYQPGRRLLLEANAGSRWVAVESIRECWETFERLGRIRRQDVLEPGRCSAFMIALFQQVPGVSEQFGEDHYLVLPT